MPFAFTLNGREIQIDGESPTATLLDFLRSKGLTGGKQGCAEGDCGACTVALLDRDAGGKTCYRAINSCIALLPMFAGREVVTVEGIGAEAPGGPQLHPVQAAMVDHYGSQCGYCTPGFVVSLFEAYYRKDCREPWQINDQLSGNLCRCTGYRPIRDAALAALASGRVADGSDRFARRLEGSLATPAKLQYSACGASFFRPTSLGELLHLKRSHPAAKLVAGATEIGVEITKKFKPFPALISVEAVPELTGISSSGAEWRIGAAATLTAIEEAVAWEYPSLAKMLAVFAGRQIRNRATLGGNLVTASPIGDSAPVLLTLDAKVVLASMEGERTVALSDFFTGYRKTEMREAEVMREIVIPRGAGTGLARRADFLKVSHRRELDISIVAGAFCVDTDSRGIVRLARLAYGGVAERPLRALRAEAALEGRTLAEASGSVAEILRGEFSPIDDVRGGAAYRLGVVVSLWEKFASDEGDAASERPGFSPRETWEAADSSRKLSHESAVGHVTGAAQYVDDIARRRAMLEVWPVCSPHARARIRSRDAAKALSVPGVAAVLMAEDVPGRNDVGVSRHDETLFAAGEVCYHGHIVALVVGESAAICREAAALVSVDYEVLPPVLTIEEAVKKESYHTEQRMLRRGDCAEALRNSPGRLAGKIAIGGQEHFYLETQAAWAEAGDSGDIFVCSSTQHPTEIQTVVSEVLGKPKHQIVVQAPRMGGAFGGKESQGNTLAALVALAAVKTGQPVRAQLDRDLDMILTGKRHPFHASFDVGYDLDGHILAAQVHLLSNGGWSLDLSQPVLDRALFHLDNAYYIPAVAFTGQVAKTNVTSQTAFRGFGGPQGMVVIEEILDRVARALGLPPEEVRERNLYRGAGETNTTHYGEEIGDNRLQEMWRLAKTEAGFARRRAELAEWNLSHGLLRRGLAITPVKFGISFTMTHYNQAGALVLVYEDGTVQINHGGTEMGQGLHTKILGIAMRELGLPSDRIRVMKTSTDKVPNTSATAASSGSDLNGAAVRDACRTLRARLLPVAAKRLGVAPGEVEFDNGLVFARRSRPPEGETATFANICKLACCERISLSATGYYKTPDIHWDWKTASGRPFYYFAGGVAVAEVEVDGSTGMSRILRVDIVHDAGDSLNPGVDRGQIEGGFVQGAGWLTSEELKWDQEGRLLTHSASTYQIPAISDAPVEFNVTLLPRAAEAGTVGGSKAVGEPPLMLALSVREAIRDAIASFGPAGGQVGLAAPATGEAVFTSIQERLAAGPARSEAARQC